jgi:nitronate monooxygenase
MRNAFVDAWDGREEELRASAEAREQFALGHQAGDPDVALVWAGEGADLITAVEPAGFLVAQIIEQAEGLLRGASRQLDH